MVMELVASSKFSALSLVITKTFDHVKGMPFWYVTSHLC